MIQIPEINSTLNSTEKEQRENLLKQNDDLLFGVYNNLGSDSSSYQLELKVNLLTCYENQLSNLEGLDENSDIIILDLMELRKGNIVSLVGCEYEENENLVLLSNGVVDYIQAEDKNGKKNKHIIITLRDGAAADEVMRTMTAGRNTGDDLNEEIEIELMGEAPYLGKNGEGDYVLLVHNNTPEKIAYLKKAITFFIKNKHLATTSKNYIEKKKLFENNFKGVLYDELPTILNDIVKNNRYLVYDLEDSEIEGLNLDIKPISLGKSSGEYYVFHDKKNNTIEYRKIKEITNIPKDFHPLSARSGRLYLESENQYPRSPRIEKAGLNTQLVPTIKKLVETLI